MDDRYGNGCPADFDLERDRNLFLNDQGTPVHDLVLAHAGNYARARNPKALVAGSVGPMGASDFGGYVPPFSHPNTKGDNKLFAAIAAAPDMTIEQAVELLGHAERQVVAMTNRIDQLEIDNKNLRRRVYDLERGVKR